MKKVVFFANLVAVSAVFGMQSNPVEQSAKSPGSSVAVRNLPASDSYRAWTPREWIAKIVGMPRNREDFNAPQNAEGQTILMCATKYADCKIMQQVLNAKDAQGYRLIDINAKDVNGDTALSIATTAGADEKTLLLLKNGADVELTKGKISNKARRKLENLINEPFLEAVYKGDFQKAKSLLENTPVDVNVRLSLSDMGMNVPQKFLMFGNLSDERVALVCAAQEGHKDIVKLLLKQSDIDINIRDNRGFSALMRAAQEKKEEIVELLLEQPNLDFLKNDYQKMEQMIHEDYSEWNEIIEFLKNLEKIIRDL